MAYFTQDDLHALNDAKGQPPEVGTALQGVYDKFRRLHTYLQAEFPKHDIFLDTYQSSRNAVGVQSCASSSSGGLLTAVYYRGETKAIVVERLMGWEIPGDNPTVDARRHPVIELRLTPSHYTIELLLTPDAWWDQRNLVGKLSVQRHSETFYNKLRDLDGEVCMGFWSGATLRDMHITVQQVPWVKILTEWMNTFEAGKDFFRIGRWYTPDDHAIAADTITAETLRQVRALYALYSQILWSSDNNFHSFFKGASRRA